MTSKRDRLVDAFEELNRHIRNLLPEDVDLIRQAGKDLLRESQVQGTAVLVDIDQVTMRRLIKASKATGKSPAELIAMSVRATAEEYSRAEGVFVVLSKDSPSSL